MGKESLQLNRKQTRKQTTQPGKGTTRQNQEQQHNLSRQYNQANQEQQHKLGGAVHRQTRSSPTQLQCSTKPGKTRATTQNWVGAVQPGKPGATTQPSESSTTVQTRKQQHKLGGAVHTRQNQEHETQARGEVLANKNWNPKVTTKLGRQLQLAFLLLLHLL
ncbi:hypothetical protein HYD98_00930 [Mycoplasmopsis bovis]|nr:hypothetical protein [Mycoplasmopsis bovis]QQH29175.1 hypothetical protein HYD98_00930 [Mycoplasmopsis bovis]